MLAETDMGASQKWREKFQADIILLNFRKTYYILNFVCEQLYASWQLSARKYQRMQHSISFFRIKTLSETIMVEHDVVERNIPLKFDIEHEQ